MKALALALLVTASCVHEYKDKEQVESEARAFAKKIGWNAKDVECVTRDSDANGYVTCSVFLGDGQVQELECTFATNEHGCKVKK